MTWALAVLPVVLLLLGVPVFLILLTTSAAVILLKGDVPLNTIHTLSFGGLDHFTLLAIPFFIFAGEVMSQGGIARRLIDWFSALIGNVRGSMALATVGTAEFFGAISGSSAGTVAAIGKLLYPALTREGYPVPFASGLVTSSGAIAIIIPPSVAMILYGVGSEQSVVKLFTAGIIPGLFIGLCAAVYIVVFARRHVPKLPRREGESQLARIARNTRDAFWAIGTPAIVLGGIYGGIVTPTEAAGIAVVYAVLVTKFIYREVTWKQLWQVTSASVLLSAQVLIVVATAAVYSWLLATSGVPQGIVAAIGGLSIEPWLLLLLINVFLLIVGCFVEPASAIIILTPLLVPIVQAAGIDLIHFGIIMTVNISIGMYTPPFGLNIFVTQSLFRIPLAQLYAGLVPFIAINIFALLVITYVPAMSLWLVK